MNFNKSKTRFSVYIQSLHYNGNENFLYVNKIVILKFEGSNNIPPFCFSLESVSKEFTNEEMEKIALNCNVGQTYIC